MPDSVSDLPIEGHRSNWLSLRTLLVVRWIAIGGQFTALLVAHQSLGIAVPLGPCVALVALSAAINLALSIVLPVNTRLTQRQVMMMLLFDITQLMGLLALTGGLENPFAFLVIAPVVVAATVLPLGPTLAISGAAIALTTLVANVHLPLLLTDGSEIRMPDLLNVGYFLAVITGIGFVAAYARQVSVEIHTMSEALLATQMALAREQKLTDLGGVVAAAAHELGTPLATIKLASSEMIPELAGHPELAEDARLIRDQADRCRDILRSMGRAGKQDSYITRAPLAAVVREAAEPHTGRGKTVRFALAEGLTEADQPLVERRPELIHGLRNLIQNAVDFARDAVDVEIGWRGAAVTLRIVDDGPGYPPQLLRRLGDPFLRRDRPDASRPEYEGMGLGLFIAKTLLERTGAELEFLNDRTRGEGGRGGALVMVSWPAAAGLAIDPRKVPAPPRNKRIAG